jgi:hypothetical protein
MGLGTSRRIADLIDADVRCLPVSRRPGTVTELLDAPVRPLGEPSAAMLYEHEVFEFLLASKKSLGIKSVFRFENLLVDGALLLDDGRYVLVEIKSQMGWLKACQAEWQLRTFLRLPEAKTYGSGFGIVFFETFIGDWARPVSGTLRGWRNWYSDHCLLGRSRETTDSFRISLVRLKGGALETAPVEQRPRMTPIVEVELAVNIAVLRAADIVPMSPSPRRCSIVPGGCTWRRLAACWRSSARCA